VTPYLCMSTREDNELLILLPLTKDTTNRVQIAERYYQHTSRTLLPFLKGLAVSIDGGLRLDTEYINTEKEDGYKGVEEIWTINPHEKVENIEILEDFNFGTECVTYISEGKSTGMIYTVGSPSTITIGTHRAPVVQGLLSSIGEYGTEDLVRLHEKYKR
jgi:hypothetical protein